MKFPERVIIEYTLIEEGKVLLNIVLTMIDEVILNIVDQCCSSAAIRISKRVGTPYSDKVISPL